jgi:HEAT repeat protein
MKALLTALVVLCTAAPAFAQKVRLDDVVRNLRNPDPRARMDALETLQEANHFDAIPAIAPLINDPIDDIQLAAIATELSFFTVDDIRARKRVAFFIETRGGGGRAESAFDAGPLAVWPRVIPPQLSSNLLKAIDDENPKVRIEAIYAFGAIAQASPAPPTPEVVEALIKALDHYDPAIRQAAARVSGRLKAPGMGAALINAVNDSQQPVRFAAMRALGDIREKTAIQALTQQVEYYKKGEGAWAALDALARIGDSASAALFKSRLTDRDEYIRRAAAEGLGRAGDASEIATLELGATKDGSAMVRLAMRFALQKLGRDSVVQILDELDNDKLLPQVAEYVFELGPAIVPELVKRLADPDNSIRGNAAVILGAVGTTEHVAALGALAQDHDRDVRRAAERAIERIKLRGA